MILRSPGTRSGWSHLRTGPSSRTSSRGHDQRKTMRRFCLIALYISAARSPVQAEPRRLTLSDAVELAMRVEPLIAEARIVADRSKLAVLRSQLDRVSLKVDGQVQELWNKTNI